MKIELHPHICLESNEISAIEKTVEILTAIERNSNDMALPEDFYKKVSEIDSALSNFYWEYC